MNPEMIELAKRAVACKGWRWMPGMRVMLSSGLILRLGERDEGSLWWAIRDSGATFTVDMSRPSYTVAPDLTDPATLGCLLALVREAWGMPTGITVSYSSDDGLWGVSWSGATHGGWCGRGKTEAEALVVALEST